MTATVMIHIRAKGQSQRSLGSKVKSGNGQTDERTDGGDCISSHANAVGRTSNRRLKLYKCCAVCTIGAAPGDSPYAIYHHLAARISSRKRKVSSLTWNFDLRSWTCLSQCQDELWHANKMSRSEITSKVICRKHWYKDIQRCLHTYWDWLLYLDH